VKSRYLLFQKTEALLIEEKAQKLFGVTRLLDRYLSGDYQAILASCRLLPVTREEKIRVLNQALSPFTDEVASAFPGVGVGYYSKDLRAILTYGPSSEFGSKVGLDLDPDHLGWQAMETGKETVGVGSMVRGEIMNCMRPIIRNGSAIGFVWANETLEDIYAQMQLGAKRVFFSQDVEPILGLTGLLLFASRVFLLGEKSRGWSRRLWRSIERLDSYLRLFLNSLSLGVVLSDYEDKITFVSQGIKDILGETAFRYVGMSVGRFLSDLGLDPYIVLDDALSGARNRFLNVNLKSTLGDKLVTIISAVVADAGRRNDTGGTGDGNHGHVVILEDLREARAQEERLARAEHLAALGELAAAVAHEIRNPLTVVKGAASLVPGKLSDPDFLRKFSEVVTSELERINRTVESLLNFARYSQPDMTPIDMENVVKRACDVIRGYAEVHKVDIHLACASVLPPVRGDADHLVQAFLNLFLNGIQAMPSGGTLFVDIEWNPGAKYVETVVKDTGSGILPEHKDRIFEMFFTTKKGGTGLGLPLVQRIIYEHQGFIEFDSEVGKGTTFVIRLPVILE